MSDEFADLLQRARKGEPPARDMLVERLLPGLRAYVRLHTGAALRAHESCSDLVQSVCIELVQDLDQFRGDHEPGLRDWVHVAALRKVFDRQRFLHAQRRDVARVVPDGEAQLQAAYASLCTPSRVAIAREELARVESAFDRLEPEQREVLTLACITGLSHPEIAARIGKSEGATRKILSRARARLALLLTE